MSDQISFTSMHEINVNHALGHTLNVPLNKHTPQLKSENLVNMDVNSLSPGPVKCIYTDPGPTLVVPIGLAMNFRPNSKSM